jgi:hypothetical protein
MLNLLILILASVGMTLIVVFGKIFDGIRPQIPPWNCTLCMGFYCGIIVNFLLFCIGMSLFSNVIIGCTIAGFISSLMSWVVSSLVDDGGIAIKLKK